MGVKAHWEQVYETKRPDEVSWFQREPAVSLDLIRRAAPDPSAAIIDVGGGASILVDRLLDDGYQALTVLDLSSAALAQSRARLGPRADAVDWREADLLTTDVPAAAFDVWHDRAVFHFLTNPGDRALYARQLRKALRPGGHVVIATFAEDGPLKCSGLSVCRYSPDAQQAELGDGFQLVDTVRDAHRTPSGSTQSFVYCLFCYQPTRDSRLHDGSASAPAASCAPK
jgi:SAM-dependent methyltransferase